MKISDVNRCLKQFGLIFLAICRKNNSFSFFSKIKGNFFFVQIAFCYRARREKLPELTC